MFDPKELRLKVLEPPLDETFEDLWWGAKLAIRPERLMVLLKESNMASTRIISGGLQMLSPLLTIDQVPLG